MAVVIRFNTILVRKARIATRYDGGLAAYRAVYLPGSATFYYEDHHLIAHTSMGAFGGVEERLASVGLSFEDRGTAADCCALNQADGVGPDCPWLRASTVGGLPVCWLAADSPGHAVDCKGRRFIQRVSETVCRSCGCAFGAGVAAMAVDAREWRDGSLAFVEPSGLTAGEGYVVVCGECGAEATCDELGRYASGVAGRD